MARVGQTVSRNSNPLRHNLRSGRTAIRRRAHRLRHEIHLGPPHRKGESQALDFGFDIRSKKYDLPQFVKADVVDAPNVAAALAQVEPPYPGYQRTIQALHTYLAYAKEYNGPQLPAIQKTIAPGDSYAGVPQLIALLRVVGDLPADASTPADATVY